MPKVPVSENRIQVKQANAEVNKVASLNSEIIGNNVFDAQQKLVKNVSDLGQAVAGYAQREQEKTSQKNILSKSDGALKDLNNLLNDPGVDEAGRPKGLLNRKNGQVGNDTLTEYDTGVSSIVDKYSTDLTDDERIKFKNMIGTHALSFRDNVAKHQVTENNNDLKNKYTSSIELQKSSASSAANDETLASMIGSTHLTIDGALKAQGMDAGSIELEKQKATNEMIKNSVFAKLEKDPEGAKKTLESFKDKISPDFYDQQTQVVDGKRFDNLRTGLYSNTFSKMKLSDGEPDIPRIEKSIESSNFTGKQKEELRTYMKSRAMEDSQNKSRFDKDVINRFSNEVLIGKKQGGTLDDALKAAGKYGGDQVDVHDREEIARKFYTDPSKKSDPDLLISLHEKILSGSSSKAEIKQAFADNKLNASDYVRLTNDHLGQKIGEGKKEDSIAWQNFKNEVDAKFSSSEKEEKANALLVFRQKTEGKSLEEKAVIGKQLLDSSVTKKGWIFDTKEPNYKIEKAKIDATNEVWGKLYQDVGQKEVNAIGSGMLRRPNGQKSWGAGDVEKFAQEFGGIDQIKKGTPVGNAINSLTAKGKMATPENIKAVLAVHKDGNY